MLLTATGHQNACIVVFAMAVGHNVRLSLALIPTLSLWTAARAIAVSILI
jgi:O-antigen/teichoic acid export membrane protein